MQFIIASLTAIRQLNKISAASYETVLLTIIPTNAYIVN